MTNPRISELAQGAVHNVGPYVTIFFTIVTRSRCNRPEYTPCRIILQYILWPRPIYTPVYYGLGQFIPPQAKLYTHDINHDVNSVERYTREFFPNKILRLQF